MYLVTSKCVPRSNGFVLNLAFLIISFLNHIASPFLFLAIIFRFLFLEIAIFLWQFVLPFLIFLSEFIFLSPSLFPPFLFLPSAFVLPVPTALL